MKTWLKQCARQIWTCREELLDAGAVLILIACAFWLGTFWGGRETAFWRSIAVTPEPERCALCGSEERYHAPCIVKLATGEIGELRVYDPDPQRTGELSPVQRTGVFSFQHCADLVGSRDTNRHTSHVTVPEEREKIDPAYFCRRCRALLANTAAGGYVLADLYDVDAIQVYPLADGAEYDIRDYTVSISGETQMEIHVTGLLP